MNLKQMTLECLENYLEELEYLLTDHLERRGELTIKNIDRADGYRADIKKVNEVLTALNKS